MKIALLAIALLALAGCDIPPRDESRTLQVHNEPGPSYFVHDIRLKDGTRCVVSTSFSHEGGVGITCDWKREGVER